MITNELREVQDALQAGDRERAQQLLMPLLQQDQNNPDMWVIAATVQQEPKLMVGALKNALNLEPGHAQASAMLNQMRQMLGDAQFEAIEQELQSGAAQATQSAPASTGSVWDRPYEPQNEVAFDAQTDDDSTTTSAAYDDEDDDDLYGDIQPTGGDTSEGTFQMLWDCTVCGTERLLGVTHRFCPNCGTQQDPDWRYYPAEDEYVRVENHQFIGRDLECAACGTLNAADADFCENCGASLETATPASTLGEQRIASGRDFKSSGPRDAAAEQWQAQMAAAGVEQDGKKKRGSGGISMKTVVILGIAALVAVGAFAAAFWTQAAGVTVTGHEWERTIVIEEYRYFETQNWDDSPPAGDQVRRGTCVQRQRSTRQVPDGEECSTVRVDNGDGTFSTRQECRTTYRSEPVYDDWCDYSGYRWEFDRNITTSGDSVSDTPVWGTVNLNCANERRTGCEREDRREEAYLVLFDNDDSDATYRCDFPQDLWRNIRVGSDWNIQVRVMDQDAGLCNTLEPAN
jgi:rubrerythrin